MAAGGLGRRRGPIAREAQQLRGISPGEMVFDSVKTVGGGASETASAC